MTGAPRLWGAFLGIGVALALAAALLAGAPPGSAAAQTAGAHAVAAATGTLAPTRALRPGTVLGPADVTVIDSPAPPGMLSDPTEAVGREAKVALYPNRPIPAGALGPPTVVFRNELVRLNFQLGGLVIQAEGRALDDGGLGDRVRAMNLDSRQTVFGIVAGPGEVVVK